MAQTMTPTDKGKKVLLWLGFSVFFALGPLFINFCWCEASLASIRLESMIAGSCF